MPIDVTDPQTIHDRLIECHRRFYTEEPHGQLYPMLIIYTPDGKGVGVALEMGDDDDRDAMAETLRAGIKDMGGVMYAFFSEAWFAAADITRPMGDQPMPSQREDRKECVLTTVICKDGTKVGSVMEINRDWETGGAVLDKVESMSGPDGLGFGGRFAELFDE
jgi:hypothetical protein